MDQTDGGNVDYVLPDPGMSYPILVNRAFQPIRAGVEQVERPEDLGAQPHRQGVHGPVAGLRRCGSDSCRALFPLSGVTLTGWARPVGARPAIARQLLYDYVGRLADIK